MMNHLGLGLVFTVRDLATSRLQRLERTFHTLDERVGLGAARIGRAFDRMGMGLAVFTAGAAAVAGGLALANVAGRFETSIAQVAAVSGASAAELDALRDSAIQAGIATQFSPTEAAAGLRELAQVGFSAGDSMRLLIPVLDLAAGSLGELTPQAAAGLAAQTMNAFGLSVDEAGVAVDRLLRSANFFALSAGDLPMALGIASRGAQALHQSLSETLISIGLVRNIVPGLERASTAVAVSMERLANPRTQRMLQEYGVAVVDRATGGFRNFLDVLQELGPALSHMTEAERSAFLMHAFGHHAMTGLAAIMSQVTNGIRTQTGELVRGADAIAYLRSGFEHAEGTAAQFRDQMLSTFEGQKNLLVGSLETLAIVLGQPFAEVFRPLIGTVIAGVNALIEVFRALPAPVLRGLAAVATVGGSFVGMVGAVLATEAALSLLVIGMEFAGVTVGALVTAFAVPIAAASALALAFAALRVAFERNVGGIADAARRTWARVSLVMQALSQLFESGELSGSVQRELSRAETSGVRRFVVALYMLGYRAMAVVGGIRDGFTAAIDAAAPALGELQVALGELGTELAALLDTFTGGARTLPSSEFRAFGSGIGSALGAVLEVLVDLVRWGVRFSTGFVRGVRETAAALKPVLTALAGAFIEVDRHLRGVSTSADALSDSRASFDVMREAGLTLARALGWVLVTLASALLSIASGVRAIVVTVRAAEERWARLTGAVREVGRVARRELAPVAEIVTSVVSTAVGAMRALFDAAASHVRAVLDAIGAALIALEARVRPVLGLVPNAVLPAAARELLGRDPAPSGDEVVPVPLSRGPAVDEARAAERAPAAAAARNRRAESASVVASFRAALGRDAGPQRTAAPTLITLQVDGETLARVTNEAASRLSARSFTPVPVY